MTQKAKPIARKNSSIFTERNARIARINELKQKRQTKSVRKRIAYHQKRIKALEGLYDPW